MQKSKKIIKKLSYISQLSLQNSRMPKGRAFVYPEEFSVTKPDISSFISSVHSLNSGESPNLS